MSEGHLLKSALSRSSKWKKTDGKDFDRWVYCMLVACVDSWGMIPADGITLKATLDPFGITHDPTDFEESVRYLHGCGLVATFTDQGATWLYLVGHDSQQSRALSKRKKNPSVARPDWVLIWDGCGNPATTPDLPATTLDQPSARADLELDLKKEVEGNQQLVASLPLSKKEQIDLLLREGVSEQTAGDFFVFRKGKRAQITHNVVEHNKKEAKDAGVTLEQALIECCARNWQTFNAAYYANAKNGGNCGNAPPKKPYRKDVPIHESR
jgi:hypothetical protein